MVASSESVKVPERAADDGREIGFAAKALARGESVVVFDGTLVLRPVRGELLCEVVDPAPSAHRCANEYEVLVENAQRALEASTLAESLPRLRRTWRVVDGAGAGAAELWRAP
jgi:hypothetical protein